MECEGHAEEGWIMSGSGDAEHVEETPSGAGRWVGVLGPLGLLLISGLLRTTFNHAVTLRRLEPRPQVTREESRRVNQMLLDFISAVSLVNESGAAFKITLDGHDNKASLRFAKEFPDGLPGSTTPIRIIPFEIDSVTIERGAASKTKSIQKMLPLGGTLEFRIADDGTVEVSDVSSDPGKNVPKAGLVERATPVLELSEGSHSSQ